MAFVTDDAKLKIAARTGRQLLLQMLAFGRPTTALHEPLALAIVFRTRHALAAVVESTALEICCGPRFRMSVAETADDQQGQHVRSDTH